MEIIALTRALGTDAERGLRDGDAAARLAEYGPNELPAPKRKPVILTFLSQFHNALMYILIAAGGLAVALGETQDAFGIGIAMALNVMVGFVLERRAEAAIERKRVFAIELFDFVMPTDHRAAVGVIEEQRRHNMAMHASVKPGSYAPAEPAASGAPGGR